jgi:hypothetical protein
MKETILVESRTRVKVFFLADGTDRNCSHQGHPFTQRESRVFCAFI